MFLCVAGSFVSADEKKIDFSRDIRPILSNNCFKCHGFDEKQRQAGLRLDVKDGIGAKLESGAIAVVPGKPEESELVNRITHADPAEKMPPAASGKRLSPEQVELIKKWVAQGGEYKTHWSFIPPVHGAPPASSRRRSA